MAATILLTARGRPQKEVPGLSGGPCVSRCRRRRRRGSGHRAADGSACGPRGLVCWLQKAWSLKNRLTNLNYHCIMTY